MALAPFVVREAAAQVIKSGGGRSDLQHRCWFPAQASRQPGLHSVPRGCPVWADSLPVPCGHALGSRCGPARLGGQDAPALVRLAAPSCATPPARMACQLAPAGCIRSAPALVGSSALHFCHTGCWLAMHVRKNLQSVSHTTHYPWPDFVLPLPLPVRGSPCS